METGELTIDLPRCQRVTWKIPNFFQLSREERYFVVSPVFRFAGRRHLRLHPNTNNQILVNIIDTTDVSYNLRFQTNSGEEIDFRRLRATPPHHHNPSLRRVPSFLISRQKLEANKDSYVPNGILTLICYLAVKCNERSPESEETNTESGVVNLQSDYRQLLQNGTDSDAFLEVSGKEFRAHRCVLRARSPVFDAMFGHQTAERESGRVVIDDLDPDCFVHFLEYMYTGVVGAGILNKHAFGLFKAADKYGVLSLKSECVEYMHRTLSVDTFCDIMILTQWHREESLLQMAIRFFKRNLQRIIVMPKWEQFLIENGKSANELLVKALVPQRQ